MVTTAREGVSSRLSGRHRRRVSPDLLPAINNGSTSSKDDGSLCDRVQAASGNNWCGACMDSTDGSTRQSRAIDNRRSIAVPVGEKALRPDVSMCSGRRSTTSRPRTTHRTGHSPGASEVRGAGDDPSILETGIKVIDLIAPLVRGGKVACTVARASARRS